MQSNPSQHDIATEAYKGPDPLKNAATGALAAERIGGIVGSATGAALGGVFYKPLDRLIARVPMLNSLVENANGALSRQKWLAGKLDVRAISAVTLGAVAGAIIGRVGGLFLGANNGKNKAEDGAAQFDRAQQEIRALRTALDENKYTPFESAPNLTVEAGNAEHEALAQETEISAAR